MAIGCLDVGITGTLQVHVTLSIDPSRSLYRYSNEIICFQEQQGGNTSCFKCGKEALGTGEILRALGVVFHPACFVCSVCSRDLTAKDTPFQADDAKNLFCRDCYNK